LTVAFGTFFGVVRKNRVLSKQVILFGNSTKLSEWSYTINHEFLHNLIWDFLVEMKIDFRENFLDHEFILNKIESVGSIIKIKNRMQNFLDLLFEKERGLQYKNGFSWLKI